MSDSELKKLFQQYDKHIDDEGFSEEIIRQLPAKRKNYRWIVSLNIFIATVIAIFALTNSYKALSKTLTISFIEQTGLVIACIMIAIIFVWDWIIDNEN